MIVTHIVADVRFIQSLSEKRRLPSYTFLSSRSSASEVILADHLLPRRKGGAKVRHAQF